MGYNIGPKIGIEGEAQFRSDIKRINDTYKALEAETKAVTAAFEAQGDEQGKLRATSKQLEKQIAEQQKKQALLDDAVKKATAQFGEESIEATRLRGALFDTQATVAKLEGELKDTKTRLDSAGNAMEEFAEDSQDAGKAALDFGDILSANVISDVIMDGLRKLGDLAKDFAVDSIEAAAEVKAANSQLEQTFGEMEASAKSSLQTISDDTNIATTRMRGSYTKIYAFAKTSGAGSAEALTIASRAMVAAADNAAYYDKSIEEATEQIQAFIKGNYANDAALGIAATETSRNTKANELYAKSFQELSESQKVDVLLAMVEAGNKASGALGQAARESDSWGNITGELAEAMRQLQAEAGKPALKKLTPVIQKITDEAYELIEDTDWDAFGETVENIADGVIEHGPEIVAAIAAVTAGIVAMKITQKVGEFASLASGILNIGTAATTAGTAVAASGTVAMASPWGLVAGVIGGAVTLITLAATSAEEAESSLAKSVEKLKTTVAESEARFAETKSGIDGAAYAAQYYVERLEELESAGLDTAEAHKEYGLVVEQLNELIPDLNLTIDEQTGLVTQNTDAIRADIKAWKENATAKALQDKFSDVLEAQGKAQAELVTSQAKLNLLADQAEDLEKRHSAAVEARSAAIRKLESATDAYYESLGRGQDAENAAKQRMDAAQASAMDLDMSVQRLAHEWNLNRISQENLTESISSAQAIVDSYNDDIQEAEASIKLFEESTEAAADTQNEAQLAIERTQAAIAELEQAYADSAAEALESIESQVGLFEELSMKSDYSAEKIIKNWQDQQAAFANYNENLQKAVDMGLDQALVQQLADGSVEHMQILDAIVNNTKVSVEEINSAFHGLSESKATVSETMGEIATDFNDELAKLEQAAKLSGINVVNGLIAGVESRQEAFAQATAGVGRYGKKGFDEFMLIKSPARRMEPSGEYVVDGAIVGAENKIADFKKVMGEVALAGQDAFLEKRLDRVAAYPSAVTSSTSYSRSVAHNYGGQIFQIYQQPGESANDLAERIMDIMQTKVAAKEAAF